MTTRTSPTAPAAPTLPTAHPGSVRHLALALLSAASFSMSGPLAKALLERGWSPSAAVAARIGIAAVVLAVPTARALRGRRHLLATRLPIIIAYGITGVAGCQLAYFYAVEHLSVGVALLLEYMSPVLLLGLFWVRHRRSPGRMTLTGAALAVGGLVLVLDVFGGAHLSLVGVLWGMGASVCSAAFFLIAGRADDDLPPMVLAGGGMAVGAVLLLGLGLLGVTPLHASTASVVVAHRHTSFLVPVLGIALISAAFAYTTGVVATRALGTRLASFVALSEVLFAVLFAWLLLGELPMPIQLVGGAVVVLGVVLVRMAPADIRPAPTDPETTPRRVAG